MEKLRLINLFTERLMLINGRIIKYAFTSLKNILQSQPVEQLNNSILYDEDDIELVIGAYEVEFCLDFLKRVRRYYFCNFIKYNGKFCVTLDEGQYLGLHERLSEFVLNDCGFDFNKEYSGNTVIYTCVIE